MNGNEKPRRSSGCDSCRKGEWLCIYLTYLCPAECSFCPAPFKGEDRIVTAFGSRLETIARYVSEQKFSGIAFSGGDCFVVFDRLMEWLTFFKKRFPSFYFWAYTSGLNLNERMMKQAAAAGLDEIRFNITASGYRSPGLLSLLHRAVSIFPHVTVEIPAIPEDREILTETLPELNDAGIHYLNLHEFFLIDGDPRIGSEYSELYSLNRIWETWIDSRSMDVIRQVKSISRKKGYRFHVHACTRRAKDRQLHLRTLMMGRIQRQSWERLTREGWLETLFLPPSSMSEEEWIPPLQTGSGYRSLERFFLHPNHAERKAPESSGGTYRLFFCPALEIGAPKKLIRFMPVPS